MTTTIYIKNNSKAYAEAWPFSDKNAADRIVSVKRYFPVDREELTETQFQTKYPDMPVIDMTDKVKAADWVLEEACRWLYDSSEWLASNEDLDKAVEGDEDSRKWVAHFGRPQDLDKLINDKDKWVRAAVAECQRPQDLDVLVHDQDVVVRMAVAGVVRSRARLTARPRDLDILVKGPEKRVRMAVARNGRPQDLDILVDDKSRDVRKEVADRQRPQDLAKLASDTDPVVSKTVAKYLEA